MGNNNNNNITEDFEISFDTDYSDDIDFVWAIANVENYEQEEDGTEHISYFLEDISIGRIDGSVAYLDEEELEALLAKEDKSKIEKLVLEVYRY